MSIDSGMLELLKSWRQTTQFSGDNDWVFASPVKLGRLPVSYPWVWKVFQRAGTQAGIGKLGTRSLRYSYRSWLDAVGTAIAVASATTGAGVANLNWSSDVRTLCQLSWLFFVSIGAERSP
jgi:integrase